MNPLNSAVKKFEYSIKLNNLELNFLNFLAESLEIVSEQNKNILISQIVKVLSELNRTDFEKFNNIIYNLIEDNKNTKRITTKDDKNEFNFEVNNNNNKIAIKEEKQQLKKRKRTHLEIEDGNDIEETQKFFKNNAKKKFKGESFLEKGEKYYHIDEDGNEWEFREKSGSHDHYYFKCSTDKCQGFGMIMRTDKGKKFKLTKNHNIPYPLHTYFTESARKDIFEKINFTQNDWLKKEFRMRYIHWFFDNNKEATENECFTFIKIKFEDKIKLEINELKSEIKTAKLSTILKNRAKETIISQLINLKDTNDESICSAYTYEIISKKNGEKKLSTLYIISNKVMIKNLLNLNMQQYFGDTTYHCIPPTIRKFKLFVISGFNLKDKKTYICLYSLIPDEKYETFNKLFTVLKNSYKFYPKFFTTDFSHSLTKALKDNFPDCNLIKCYFHWTQAIMKNIKKLGLFEKDKINKTRELLFNVKLMAFIEPKLLEKFYKLITKKFGDEYEKFFQ